MGFRFEKRAMREHDDMLLRRGFRVGLFYGFALTTTAFLLFDLAR